MVTGLQGRPIIIGEVLFDCFSDGREVLGGAPFNVAWHLHAFGQFPLFISRIGNDARGVQVLKAIDDWDMDPGGIQLDAQYPTGTVAITMDGRDHQFSILPEQAYDYIDPQAALSLPGVRDAALLYSGSLIERSPLPRAVVAALRTRQIPHFIDVNLRQPWWQKAAVHNLLRGVRWAKLNQDELLELGYAGETADAATTMCREFGFEQLIVTCGEAGALLCNDQGIIQGAPVAVERVVDTVGAGDAFSAVIILGLLRGWDSEHTLSRALAFAASQCEVQGATRMDRHFYQQWLARWGEESI